MQHINGEYAKWFNRRFGRRGHLWADRFQNPELLDRKALQECLLYIELNAVRAGLVKRAEQWPASSAWARWQGQAEDLMPLEEIFPEVPIQDVFRLYRARLDQRTGPPKPATGQAAQPAGSIRFSRRLRFFTNGLAIGSAENVSQVLARLRAQGTYRYRKKPIAQLCGFLFTVRQPRSHARK
jgi:hypothetical protein